MSKVPTHGQKDFTKDRLGRAFVVARGEQFLPLRSFYRLTDSAVFERVAAALLGNGLVRMWAIELFRENRRMGADGALDVLTAAVQETRNLTVQEARTLVREQVARLLAPGVEGGVSTKGKTARDFSRTVRKDQVRSLRQFRR
jgi:hypothetical protein